MASEDRFQGADAASIAQAIGLMGSITKVGLMHFISQTSLCYALVLAVTLFAPRRVFSPRTPGDCTVWVPQKASQEEQPQLEEEVFRLKWSQPHLLCGPLQERSAEGKCSSDDANDGETSRLVG